MARLERVLREAGRAYSKDLSKCLPGGKLKNRQILSEYGLSQKWESSNTNMQKITHHDALPRKLVFKEKLKGICASNSD
jgi:hypothetical protein